MLKRLNIGGKITALMVLVVLITIVAVSVLSFNFAQDSIEERYANNLLAVNDLKTDKIRNFMDKQENDLRMLMDIPAMRSNYNLFGQYEETNQDSIANALSQNLDQTMPALTNHLSFTNLLITNKQGKIIYTTNDSDPTQQAGSSFNDPDGATISGAADSLYYSSVFRSEDHYLMYIGLPLTNPEGEKLGIIFGEINLKPIYKIISDTTGLGNTGETLLGKRANDEDEVVYLNPLRHKKRTALRESVFIGSENGEAIQQAFAGKKGASFFNDYRGTPTLAAWQKIPELNWGIVSKIDVSEISRQTNNLIYKFTIAGLVVTVLSIMLAVVFSRVLTKPLLSLKSTLQLLGRGILPSNVERKSNDEIGEMAETTDHMVQGLKRTAHFAHEIGEGKFDTDFQPLSEDDTLGNALLNMRDSIQEAEKRDKQRNWIVNGVAEIGEILRAHNNLQELGDAVIAYVTNKVEAVQGAFYVVNDDDENKKFIELQSSYAYGKKKYLNGQFKFAEGLVGQAAIEQDTLVRTEIPRDYVTITSGLLGEQRPQCILIVPLITNEEVYGVIELAGFERFSETQVKFVEEISVIIARTVFNIKVNERTRNLLEESQKMSNELQEQQEVLRQNAEEMEATQEELKRTNQQLEDQIEEVNKTQKRMAILLENASEVITIYEENAKVRYISPSVERILGYSQDEMVGKNDIENVEEDWKETFQQMFSDLLENPDESITIQLLYKRKNGETIWLEQTGTNLLNDPAIQGIVVNSRDITERRRAEQEERMRSKMQALSENSPDLITRMNEEGTFFYINPVIESYTGYKPDHYLRKDIQELDLNGNVINEWLNIIQDVKEKKDKVDKEMDFPSLLGDRIMHVNAIPEFDEQSDLESVLVVSHDITERKLIELEIQNKNKKITESINYAKRIQGAILPNNNVLNQSLKDSFILYKARDVVSGDFPWFLQRGDDVFIAAVDCTGHGVPGALISLIGYFLLNDIVRSRKVTDPGAILDQLDEGVTKTLRQDSEDAKTKDGMDIALCKINMKKMEMQYAGAHRPLYSIMNGEMNEVKGDKFPIGGGTYKNQTNFTTTTLKMNEGDSIFISSDGFPDQFGGPENRKFGPKRLRNLIQDYHQHSMAEVHDIFDKEWEAWKKDEKQTDDVLVIGIKF